MDGDALRRWGPALATAVVLFLVSIGQGSGGGLGAGPFGLAGADKWLHAGGYALLAFLVALARGRTEWGALVAAVALTVGFGGAVEVVQGGLPWRSASALDLLADAVGAVVGVAAFAGWRHLASDEDTGGRRRP